MAGIGAIRRTIAVVAAATTLALVGAGSAHAAVASTVTAKFNATTEKFHGKVNSGNGECVAHRTVRLLKKTSSGHTLVGRTTSRATGGWTIELMHAHGHYYAKIPKETEMTTHCGGDRSPIVDVM